MTLQSYLYTLLRWWWLIVIATILAAATAYYFSLQLTPIYQARVTLLVGQTVQADGQIEQDFESNERLAKLYANIVRRRPTLQTVIDSLELPMDWERLRSRIQTRIVEDTTLLEIEAESPVPETAQQIADSLAEQLLLMSSPDEVSQEEAAQLEFVQGRLVDLKAKIEYGQTRVQALEQSILDAPTPIDRNTLQAELNTLENLISAWESNYAELIRLEQEVEPVNLLSIVEPAQVALEPIRPIIPLNTLLGGIVGLMLVTGLIILREFLDSRLKTATDLSQVLDLPTLGVIQRQPNKGSQNKLIANGSAFSQAVESYDMLRSNLEFMTSDHSLKAILLTSAAEGEGKSLTAANLGISFTLAGLRTIIVDTDLRRPSQHELFQVNNQKGVTDFLWSTGDELCDYLKSTRYKNLQVMTAGQMPANPNPSALLSSNRMCSLMARLDTQADIVIYDSPPATIVSDALLLSRIIDCVLLVVRAGGTRAGDAEQAVFNLKRANAHLTGCVLNQAPARVNRLY